MELVENLQPSKISFSKAKYFVYLVCLYGAVSGMIHLRVNEIQPAPYMDEIFHIPQCQKYCRGLYHEWDPKITTLPGTYIITTTVFRVIRSVIPLEDPCSTFNLRAFSLGVSVMNLCMIYFILGYYTPEISAAKRALSALNIATFPVLYFCSFLYYTDTVSTAFLLLMHCFYLTGYYGSSAFAGGYSVFARQTNIVWVMYHGINSILDVLTNKFGEIIFLYPLEYRKYLLGNASSSKIKKGKRSKSTKRPKKVNKPFHLPSISRIWQECGDEFGDRGCAYVLMGIGFLMFVVYNGSIVVGDKQAHKATVNFPQIGYFTIVFGVFTAPFLILRIHTVISKITNYPCNILFFAATFASLIHYNTPVHPYLLADNRHYTFYIWKRFYEQISCLRFVWIPFYILVWVFIISAMGVQKVFLFTYVFCTAINIVPQLLMEFRYFIPAYLFARLTFKDATWVELFLEFCINQLFNFATIHVFLYKPFKWPDSDESQRFMW